MANATIILNPATARVLEKLQKQAQIVESNSIQLAKALALVKQCPSSIPRSHTALDVLRYIESTGAIILDVKKNVVEIIR